MHLNVSYEWVEKRVQSEGKYCLSKNLNQCPQRHVFIPDDCLYRPNVLTIGVRFSVIG